MNFKKLLWLLYLLTPALLAVGFQEQEVMLLYRSKKCLLTYGYIERNDSTFLVGKLTEKSTGDPVYNMNIELIGHRIGTVPNLNGEFRLLLIDQKGLVRFNKIGFDVFEFKYNVR